MSEDLLTTEDVSSFLNSLDDSRRDEILREKARADKMAEIAKYRWVIAQKAHRLANGAPLDFKKYPYQEAIYRDEALEIVVMGSTQWGKFLAKDADVHTPFGWKKMGDLSVGDSVSSVDGGPSKVTNIFPQGIQKLYKFTFEDGRTAEAGLDHLWEIFCDGKTSVVTTEEILRRMNTSVVSIPLASPIDDQLNSREKKFDLFQRIVGKHRFKKDRYFCVERKFANTLVDLIRSLGGVAKVFLLRENSYLVEYDLNAKHLKISSIEYSRDTDCQCIMVDHQRKLYITNNYVVTHNSEWTICTSAAMAAVGLNVFYVVSKYDKRDRFVASRITPALREIPLYRKMLDAAKARNADTDSSRFKAFGLGSMNFVGSNSPKDFTSYQADAAIIDEHQECVIENIGRVDSRMNGSPWRFKIIVGNPRIVGTEENLNLDYEYNNTDRRQWQIPCDYCGVFQTLGWWTHFVREERRNGAILLVEPLDKEHQIGDRFDLRPICQSCNRPMNRLHQGGLWVAQNPGHVRHGYQLSNLYNVNVRMDKLFSAYKQGLASPMRMAEFVNDQLGIPWTMDGSSITAAMLQTAARGENAQILPYRIIPASQVNWRELEAA